MFLKDTGMLVEQIRKFILHFSPEDQTAYEQNIVLWTIIYSKNAQVTLNSAGAPLLKMLFILSWIVRNMPINEQASML